MQVCSLLNVDDFYRDLDAIDRAQQSHPELWAAVAAAERATGAAAVAVSRIAHYGYSFEAYRDAEINHVECQLAEFGPKLAFGSVIREFDYANRCTLEQERFLRFKMDALRSMPELDLQSFICALTERLWEFPWEHPSRDHRKEPNGR